ncbi:unnamed protein product [Cylindrotheca closterium]|uniref:Uncharacterized protein n=1 Tax=Cylindrotheca closterium TaxID=2856 RepID=A0AAD2FIM6_9STRA|nr:unnamed protein product [Cylindrotheca closterium]
MNGNGNRFVARFFTMGLLLLIISLLSNLVVVEGWMVTEAPMVSHGQRRRPDFAAFTIKTHISTSTTRLEAKGKNKRRNRDKNAETMGEEDDKRRSDGKRIGRTRKSIDPNSNNGGFPKKKKGKPQSKKNEGTDPTETQQIVTFDQLQTKRCWLRLETKTNPSPPPPAGLPLDICLVEIQDNAWWKSQEEFQSSTIDGEQKDHEKKINNPYGTRVWPPSLALAEFLSDYILTPTDPIISESNTTTTRTTPSYQVLEIGCGTGLVSMAAALCGAKTMATDVAPMTLRLLQQGWSETCDKQRKHKEKIKAKQLRPPLPEEQGDDPCKIMDGNLEMALFDVTSSDPLPWPKEASDSNGADKPQRILVASAVFYDASLAKAIAQRCFHACHEERAWVILADDDTGLREGGREVFEVAWERLVANDSRKKKKKKSPWVHTTVEQKTVFGWVNKPVQLLHLNYPEHLQFP